MAMYRTYTCVIAYVPPNESVLETFEIIDIYQDLVGLSWLTKGSTEKGIEIGRKCDGDREVDFGTHTSAL